MDHPPSLQRCCTAPLAEKSARWTASTRRCNFMYQRCRDAHKPHTGGMGRCMHDVKQYSAVQLSTTQYNSIYTEHIYRCTFTGVHLHVYVYMCTFTGVHLHSAPSGSPIPVVSLRGQAERSPLLTDTTLRSSRSRGPSEACGGRVAGVQGSPGYPSDYGEQGHAIPTWVRLKGRVNKAANS